MYIKEYYFSFVAQWFINAYNQYYQVKNNNQKRTKEQQDKEAKLHEKIGQLTIELDWLKKKNGIEQ